MGRGKVGGARVRSKSIMCFFDMKDIVGDELNCNMMEKEPEETRV